MTDLIKRSKKGDKEAFALLMDMHRQMLYNTALLVLHQEDDALDAIQDAILACWEKTCPPCGRTSTSRRGW